MINQQTAGVHGEWTEDEDEDSKTVPQVSPGIFRKCNSLNSEPIKNVDQGVAQQTPKSLQQSCDYIPVPEKDKSGHDDTLISGGGEVFLLE